MSRSRARPATPLPLERGERLLYRAKRHWISLLRRLAVPLVLWLIVVVVFLLRLPGGHLDLLELLLFIAGLLLFAWMVYVYFDWTNDLLFVTNKRVVHVDQVLFFSSERSELLIDSIENVNIETESIIARQLGYGDVVVQTASRMRNIRFDYAQHPQRIQRTIMAAVTPVRTGQAEERVKQVVRARVLGHGEEPQRPAPVHLLPRDFFGKGFGLLFPANPHQDGDSIIWHKHWIFALASLLDPLLLLAILVVGHVVLTQAGIFSGALELTLFVLGVIGTLGWMIYRWFDWIDDIYVLSPNDVVDIEAHPLGKEDRKQASLSAILNVTSDQPNIIARILDYGHVYLQTAGGSGEFSFNFVPEPDKVQSVIFDYLDSFKQRQQERERFATLDLIRQYHLLQGEDGDAPNGDAPNGGTPNGGTPNGGAPGTHA